MSTGMMASMFGRWTEHTLGAINLFAGVETETVLKLGRKASWRRHPPGKALIRAGDVHTAFFALVHGSTRLRFRDGGADIVAEAGETLGLRMAFFDGPAWATIRATTPVLVAEIPRADLLDAMAVSPALATNVGRMLSARGPEPAPRERLDTQIMKALAQAVDGAAGAGGEARLAAPVDPAVWATLLGVDQSDVRRALARLERHGVLRRSARGVHYVDLGRLGERLR